MRAFLYIIIALIMISVFSIYITVPVMLYNLGLGVLVSVVGGVLVGYFLTAHYLDGKFF